MIRRRSTNQPREAKPFTLHLVDGTYELFRHFYGLRRFNKGVDRPYGAVVGVLQTVLQMIDSGDMLADPDAEKANRVMKAIMEMGKIDIVALNKAAISS